MVKVALFTSQDIGFQLVQSFSQKKNITLKVYTYDTPNDVGHKYRSALEYCKQNGVDCTEVGRITNDIVATVKDFKPDIMVSAYFAKIFPETLLAIPRLGAINIHPAKLPYYRGSFPTAWALVHGETDFGISIHKIDKGIDTGDVYIQKVFPIHTEETGFELYSRSMSLGASLLNEVFDDIASGKLLPHKQEGSGSYFGKFPPRLELCWKEKVPTLLRQIRAHALPYLPAYSFLRNRCVYINRAEAISVENYRSQGAGIIQKVFDDRSFVVSCGEGCLWIKDYTLAPENASTISQYIVAQARFEEKSS